MTARGPRALPMVGQAARSEGGWTRRFIAEGERADEMIRLYRALGFEVVADPVRIEDDPTGCSICFTSTEGEHRAIYTRPKAGVPDRTAPDTKSDSNGTSG